DWGMCRGVPPPAGGFDRRRRCRFFSAAGAGLEVEAPRRVWLWTRLLLDVLPGLTDSRDLLGVLVRYLETGVLLERVDQLDQVERVGVEVLLEGGVHRHLLRLAAEALDDDVLEVFEA